MSFEMDSSQADFVTGAISGIAATIKTDSYVSAVIGYVHAKVAPEIDLAIDRLARDHPEAFLHVYEWGDSYAPAAEDRSIGDPEKRLWVQTLTGHGRNKVASFKFLASRKPVPVNPILLIPNPSTGAVVKQGVHIFYNKATVMEYGLPVHIAPELAKFLAFVAGKESAGVGTSAGAGTNKDGSVAFSKGVDVEDAGGHHTTGSFTAAFIELWASWAPTLFDDAIRPGLEEDLKATTEAALIGVRKRTQSFTIKGGAERGKMDFEAGRDYAVMVTLNKERDYIAGARARRELIYGAAEE